MRYFLVVFLAASSYANTVIEFVTATAVLPGDQDFASATAGLSFSFEVVGPPTIAVPVDVGFSQYCNTVLLGVGDFSVCNNAEITSPGFYLPDIFNVPTGPAMSGSVPLELASFFWFVPNEWNQAGVSAQVSIDEPAQFFQGLTDRPRPRWC